MTHICQPLMVTNTFHETCDFVIDHSTVLFPDYFMNLQCNVLILQFREFSQNEELNLLLRIHFLGNYYDYHGIGEFWGCKSKTNDFGFQLRFFFFGSGSLTGGVAVKAGESVVTVVSLITSEPLDQPTLR